ncbi:PfkB family carbohydrate kinase [Mahella sp.]|uniref:bifunctional heptose 7-phosphate kinase/heptose 1-phosphate adenyltransferase n=1 Tax=Mahella sp. TaxID=2798721 RepID=UPI0025BEF70E|nr:PfkB family carbohydrate kinase [Mahella sp.]MBZ4665559.1 PfkB domain protein [Mahella sp.]
MSRTTYKIIGGIDRKRAEDILDGIGTLKVAIVGDIALDVYWRADMTKSELSRETPHFPLPVIQEWMSPGGAGNVAANVAALNPSKVCMIGIIGDDWRGDVLFKELKKRSIDAAGVIKCADRFTNAYCKPLRRGISDVEYEDPRIDFENFSPLAEADEKRLTNEIERIAADSDMLCVIDQMRFGCITPAIRDKIMQLSSQGVKIIVDSRDRIGLYKNVILKPNDVEAYRAMDSDKDPKGAGIDELAGIASALSKRNHSPVCMTLGPRGCVYVEGGEAYYIPSPEIEPPIDTCGAGDTFLSAFSCALALGAEGYEAAAVANIASSITVKKIGMTGTATIKEIKSRVGLNT